MAQQRDNISSTGRVGDRVPTNGPLPRVLFALVMDPGVKFGSAEEQLMLIADAFNRAGSLFLPLFITHLQKEHVDDFVTRGMKAECLELRCFHIRTLFQLRRIIRRHQIAVVHWNYTNPLRNWYVWALSVLCPELGHWYTDHISRKLPIPDPPGGVKRYLKRLLLKRYQTVICVSQYVRSCLERQGTWSNLVAHTHFVNPIRFKPNRIVRNEIRRECDANDKFVLLCVGQLIPEKGLEVALRAMSSLPSRIVLWIIGAGPTEQELRALTGELGLNERVRLLGLQYNVQSFMQAADVLLCPSVWGEAAGLVTLEGQACGLPVVASRIGGIPEYVAEERSGLLFEPGNPNDLARQVLRLLNEPDLFRRLSTGARAWIRKQFSPDVRLPKLLDLYRTRG
jgi:glycosyltransferase involved in cell wall biosynthesis